MYDVKYAPYADEYMGMANGSAYEHLKRWLKRRILFTDSLYDYVPSYADSITIRANTTEEMRIEIETYAPVYQHMSWYNNQMDKKKIDGKSAVVFTGKAQASTDQEVLIYGGSNIKRIRGLSTMNPDSMVIGNASKLVELECSNAPLLTDINQNKANLSPNKYLTKVDISNCPLLGGTLRLNNSPLLSEVNAQGTAITGMLLPTSIKNLATLKVPKGVTELTLNDAKTLTTLDLEEGYLLETLSLSNCNKLNSFDLSKVKNISLDNSYNVEELRLSTNENVTLKNMSALKKLIYTPNNEIEEFDLTTLKNSPDVIVSTFNCPNLKDFITTAPQRESYGESDDNIYPNKLFMANKLDLSDTQLEEVKFLCTTDVFDLKLPTTVKNFYCDSAFDLDTNVITDGDYDVIHSDLIQPYTEEYNENVNLNMNVKSDMFIYENQIVLNTTGEVAKDGTTNFITTDFINISPSSQITSNKGIMRIGYYNDNKSFISCTNQAITETVAPSNAKYIRITIYKTDLNEIKITYFSTPNIVPTSANGSLLFNINTTPSDISPYIWNLQGLKLKDFYTYGVNNRVKVDDIEYKVKTKLINKWSYGSHLGGQKSNRRCLPPLSFDESINSIRITSDNTICHTIQTVQDGSGVGQSVWGTDLSITFTGDYATYRTIGITLIEKDVNWIKITCDNNKVYVIYINELEQIEISTGTECLNLKRNIDDITNVVLNELTSITMPKRLADYKVQIKNADITPTNYNTMLYPKLVDTTLPITGKLDYSKYKGKYLSWAFAYTTNDVVRTALDSRSQGQIINDYNKLYQTDYVDIVDVWAYKDDDFTSRANNPNITKAYIELTQDNYKTRIDEVLQWYSNCTELYLFEDGSVTSLSDMFNPANKQVNNRQCANRITKVEFMNDYFDNLTNLYATFKEMGNLIEVKNIPNTVTNMSYCFYGDSKFTTLGNMPTSVSNLKFAFYNNSVLNSYFDLSTYNLENGGLVSTWQGCSLLDKTPTLPINYSGSFSSALAGTSVEKSPVFPDSITEINGCFRDCKKLKTVGNIPKNCEGFGGAFAYCSSLISVPETGWKIGTGSLFAGCTSLNQKIVIESTRDLTFTFSACNSLEITPVLPKSFDITVRNNKSMESCFNGCTKLKEPAITPDNTLSMKSAYQGCTSLTSAPNIPDSVINIFQICFHCVNMGGTIIIPLKNISSYGNGLSDTNSNLNIKWIDKRLSDFDLTVLKSSPSYTQEDLKDLVNNHLEDLYKDKVKISFGDKKVTINDTETTIE